jgi:hypothetical protein
VFVAEGVGDGIHQNVAASAANACGTVHKDRRGLCVILTAPGRMFDGHVNVTHQVQEHLGRFGYVKVGPTDALNVRDFALLFGRTLVPKVEDSLDVVVVLAHTLGLGNGRTKVKARRRHIGLILVTRLGDKLQPQVAIFDRIPVFATFVAATFELFGEPVRRRQSFVQSKTCS